MDILREVSSIASAHGTNALWKMLGKKIALSLPVLGTLGTDKVIEMDDPENVILSVQSRILTGLEGKVILALEERTAFNLINLCYKGKGSLEATGFLTEVGLSVLKEVSNIVIASYVGALSMFLNTVVIPSPPVFLSGSFHEMVNSAITMERKYFLTIDTLFQIDEQNIKGRMLLVITENSMEMIQRACKKMLEK